MIVQLMLSCMLILLPNSNGKIIIVTSENQLQQALQAAKPGDEIVIKAGTYFGNFSIIYLSSII